jgi:hypothetical protein
MRDAYLATAHAGQVALRFQYAARNQFAHALGVEDIGNDWVALRVQRHRVSHDAGGFSELPIAVGKQSCIDPGDASISQRGDALPLLVSEMDIAVEAFVRITQATIYRQQANQDIVAECFEFLLRQRRRIELPCRVVLEGHEGVILPLPRHIGPTQIIQHHAQTAVGQFSQAAQHGIAAGRVRLVAVH